MSKKDGQAKPRYEPPVVVPLGELAKGDGSCSPGSVGTGACNPGTAANPCNDGTLAINGCHTGSGIV
jgi:hypothetical protein